MPTSFDAPESLLPAAPVRPVGSAPSTPPLAPPTVPPDAPSGAIRPGRVWPHRPRWVLATVAGLAVTTDQLFRTTTTGFGATIVIGAAILMVTRLSTTHARVAVAPLVLSLAAASILAIRQSPVVVTLAALASVVLLFLGAAGDGAARLPLAATTGRSLAGLVDGPRWLLRPRRPGRQRRHTLVIRSLVVSTIVAVAVGFALAAADPVFAQIMSELGEGPSLDGGFRWALLACPFASLALLATTRVPALEPTSIGHRPLGAEGVVGVASLAIVLGAWCATQLVVALGGARHVLESVGLTRAEYARSGFFQLVFVTALILGVVLVLERVTAPEMLDPWFVAAATVVMAETLVLVVATGSRLAVYIDAFGLTLTRTVAAWILCWLALLVVRTWLGIVQRRTGTDPAGGAALGSRFVVYSAAIAIIAFGGWNPEAQIVEINLGRAAAGAELDLGYLTGLSSDGLVALGEHRPAFADDTRSASAIDRAICRESTSRARWNPNWSFRRLDQLQRERAC